MRVTRPQLLRIYDEIMRVIKGMRKEELSAYFANSEYTLKQLLTNLFDCLDENPHINIAVVQKHRMEIYEVYALLCEGKDMQVLKNIIAAKLEDSMAIIKLAFLEQPFTSDQWKAGFSSHIAKQN